jgi:hypothetical protein
MPLCLLPFVLWYALPLSFADQCQCQCQWLYLSAETFPDQKPTYGFNHSFTLISTHPQLCVCVCESLIYSYFHPPPNTFVCVFLPHTITAPPTRGTFERKKVERVCVFFGGGGGNRRLRRREKREKEMRELEEGSRRVL